MVQKLYIYLYQISWSFFIGVSYLNNLIIGAKPNSSLYLKITSDSLDDYCGHDLSEEKIKKNEGCFLLLKVYLRECLPGEIKIERLNMFLFL